MSSSNSRDKELFLAPMRHGTLLMSSSPLSTHQPADSMNKRRNVIATSGTPKGWIPLTKSERNSSTSVNNNLRNKPQVTTTLLLGRPDFLSSLFRACGCTTNVTSSKNKCKECRKVLLWAGNLSRQMLQIVNGNQVATRGSLAAVVIHNSHNIEGICSHRGHNPHRTDSFNDASLAMMLTSSLKGEEDDDNTEAYRINSSFRVKDPREWSKSHTIRQGMVVSLRYDDEKFDFFVTSQEDIDMRTSSKISTMLRNLVIHRNQSNRLQGAQQNLPSEDPWSRQTTTTTPMSSPPASSTRKDLKNPAIRIWFCPRGQDLPKKRVEILSNCLRDPSSGARVVQSHCDATHWIISGQVSFSQVARVLKTTEDNLTSFLDAHDVTCVKPRWLHSVEGCVPLPPPSALDLWYGYFPEDKRKHDGTNGSCKRRRIHKESHPRNLTISNCFLKLSKLYEQAPYLPEDGMKARSFHMIAGRLQKIDFEIQRDTPISTLKNVPIIGPSAASMIQEIVMTGQLKRLEGVQRDPIRSAMRNAMAIWGVGRATALDLVHQGYSDIEHVRRGIASGELTYLDWKQQIGVECYEDFLVDMNRSEVEMIFKLVQEEAQKVLPECEAEIMGSHRRGKKELGDVDVLIVSKHHQKCIPTNALPELVNNLCQKGHVAFHLTPLPGLQLTKSQDTRENIPIPEKPAVAVHSNTPSRRKGHNISTTGCATYMGVFFSPTMKGRRHRVDIKIWPYNQKPFASLYFTGSKYFNRSMRQYAKSKFHWTLNDKGIFCVNTGERVMTTARSEKDVFDKLLLVYKAPKDRKFFDDVHPL